MTDVEIGMEAARIGAKVLLQYWEHLNKEDADLKARHDWVSRADRESETAIISYLRQVVPGDACLGEESGFSDGSMTNARRTWIIDPLDGTSNYLQHFPFWSVSIGLRDGAEMVAGVVYEPLREQMFSAERGAGSFRNGHRMHVSDHEAVEGAFIATGFPFRAQKHVGLYCSIFADVISLAKGVRRAGSAALDLAYTAAGVFDGFFELHLAPWDVAAGAVLITEAGGIVSDFSGGNQFWTRGNIVGAPPKMHRAILDLIARHACEQDLDR